MDESVTRLFEQQVRPLRLSEAIRLGCPYIEESDLYSGCAIGTGYRHLTGRSLREDLLNGLGDGPEEMVARAFGIPLRPVMRVSARHYEGGMTREQCADYLEGLGY